MRGFAVLTSLQDRIYARTEGYRFGNVLILLVLTFVYLSAAPPEHWAQVGSVILESAAVLTALVASRVSRAAFQIAVLVIVASFAVTVAAIGFGVNPRVPIGTFVSMLLTIAVPAAIARALWKRGLVDIRTVLGALAIYMSIGLFFAFLFSAIHEVTDKPVFAQHVVETSADFVYFSFVTVATVGYGDLTATGGFARAFAALEGVTGQLYLVTVVALLVSNLRPRRAADRTEGGPATETPP